jgi:hypothetical protein
MKPHIMQSSPASVISSLLGPYILFSMRFSDTFNLCSHNARNQVSNTYKNIDKIIGLYVIAFTFQNSRQEEREKNPLVLSFPSS